MSKKYIGYENVTIRKLVCNHPSVTKIWEYGGYAAIPTNGEAKRYLDVMLQDGTRKEFSDNGDGSAVEKMEEYLQEIKDEQEQSSIEWKWTDELVKEFRMFIGKFSVSHDDAIPAFKKYKNGENFLWTEQSSRPFVWDDYGIPSDMATFKQSKLEEINTTISTGISVGRTEEEYNINAYPHKPQEQTKRIEVTVFGASWIGDNPEKLVVEFSNPINEEKLPEIRKEIQKIINNE